MNRLIARVRPMMAGMLAAAVLCALAGAASGASIPRAPSHRAPVLNWFTDDLPRVDVAVPSTPATVPPRRPARPAARWRVADDRRAAPRDTLFRSHVTRISLPPPLAGFD